MKAEAKLKLGFVVTFVVMILTAIVPFGTAYWAHSLQAQLQASQRTIEDLGGTLSLVQDAETGQRGFIITGREDFLEPYHGALVQLRQARTDLRRDAQIQPERAAQLQRLEQLVGLKLAELEQTVALRRTQGFEGVQPIVAAASGKAYMDEIRSVIADLVAKQNQHRTELQSELDRRTDVDAYVGLLATLIDMLLLAALLFGLSRLIKERQRVNLALQRSTEELNASLAALEQRNAEMSLVGQMTRALESPMSMKETLPLWRGGIRADPARVRQAGGLRTGADDGRQRAPARRA
jgi:CHASE3 domain sensor protein